MRKSHVFIGLLLVCSLATTTLAADQNGVLWDRSNANEVIRLTGIEATVNDLADISSLADGSYTVARLKDIENRSHWPLPAREAAIFQFTHSLADLPREAVAPEIMEYLQNYQARTLVPHEDHPDALIPLFNIRGAAVGVENGWQRVEFATEATVLIEKNPAALVSAYAESSSQTKRSGYREAVRHADTTDVMKLQDVLMEQIGQFSSLTPLLAETAAITANTFAVQQLLVNGRGAGLSAALVQLDQRLQPNETAGLLDFAIKSANPTNATLAIAAWWPRLRHDAVTRELLIKKLADPDLGSSAALALARQPDIQTIRELQQAAAGDTLAARHAQMALDLARQGLVGDLPR